MPARRLGGISGKHVVRALQRDGFEILRINGSHHVLRKPGAPASKVIVPVNGSQDLPPGTLRTIITQAGLTTDEFIALL